MTVQGTFDVRIRQVFVMVLFVVTSRWCRMIVSLVAVVVKRVGFLGVLRICISDDGRC